jgi:hypothetical protein
MSGKYRLQWAEEQYWIISVAPGASLIRSSGRCFEFASNLEIRIGRNGRPAVLSGGNTLRSDGQK